MRNRYNQVPHLTQDTNGKLTNSQLYTTDESQEVIPFPAGDHKAQINRRAQRLEIHFNYTKKNTNVEYKQVFIQIQNSGYGTHYPLLRIG